MNTINLRPLALTDVTLHTACAGENASISFKEKLTIFNRLDALHIDYIECAPMSSSEAGKKLDSLLLRTAGASLRHSALSLTVALDEKNVDDAAQVLAAVGKINADGHTHRLSVRMPVSPVQLEYVCHRKPDGALTLLESIVRRCRTTCDEVEFAADDATRSDTAFLAKAIAVAVAAGATTVTICDTAGAMLPGELSSFIVSLREQIPSLASVRLAVECRNEFGLAAASALETLGENVSEIKVSADNSYPALALVGQFLRARSDSIGIHCRLRGTELLRTVKQISEIVSSGSHIHSSFNRSGVQGDEAEINASEIKTVSDIAQAVAKLGYELTDEETAKVYDEFVRLAAVKTVDTRELDAITASVQKQVPPTYMLESYVVTGANIISSTAHIILTRDGEKFEGLSVGDGPVDAALRAIENIIGHHYELDDYQIQSVTGGQGAMGSCLIKLRCGGKIYGGTGLSTDIIGASILAYIASLNKIIFEEGTK